MRKILLLLILLASGQTSLAIERPPGYAQAQSVFDGLGSENKIILQVMMTAAGFWWQIPSRDYGQHLFEATQTYQSAIGDPPTGVFTKAEMEELIRLSEPNLRYWGFAEVPHPLRGRPIWMPLGIGGKLERRGDNISFTANDLDLDYRYLPDAPLEASYRYMLDKLGREGQTILYHVMRNGFFAINAEKNGRSEYLRYHQDGDGLLGFTLFWQSNNAPLYGNRISVLISSSLSNQMLGTPMPAAPRYDSTGPRIANAAPQEGRSIAPPTALSPKRPSEETFYSGSGVFVDGNGHVLTNNHVIEDCSSSIKVFANQEQAAGAGVVARDATNDLALLATGLTPVAFAGLRESVRQGEAVAAFGYPHTDVLAKSGNFTLGNVTALAGVDDDSRFLQISTPVQSGNSGGPLLDQSGNLVGIVSSKLNALKILEASGDLPQNVNFAIKASLAARFLEENHIHFARGTAAGALKPEDLADQARSVSVFILCKGANN